MINRLVVTALVVGVLAGLLVFAIDEFDNQNLSDEEIEVGIARLEEGRPLDEPNILLRSPLLTGAGVAVAVLVVGSLLVIANNSGRRD